MNDILHGHIDTSMKAFAPRFILSAVRGGRSNPPITKKALAPFTTSQAANDASLVFDLEWGLRINNSSEFQ
jgi:hypothetical protein